MPSGWSRRGAVRAMPPQRGRARRTSIRPPVEVHRADAAVRRDRRVPRAARCLAGRAGGTGSARSATTSSSPSPVTGWRAARPLPAADSLPPPPPPPPPRRDVLQLARIRRRVYSTFVALAARRSGPTTPTVGMTTAHAVSDGGRRALLRKTLCACAVVVFTAGITHRAAAATTTIGFEPPEYTVEQSVVTVPGATSSGWRGLRPGRDAIGIECPAFDPSGLCRTAGMPEWRQRAEHHVYRRHECRVGGRGCRERWRRILLSGSDTCPVWARLVGRDATGAPIVRPTAATSWYPAARPPCRPVRSLPRWPCRTHRPASAP